MNSSQVRIHILLPILNEQDRLREFTDYFYSKLLPIYPDLSLWIISTEKEKIEYPDSDTLEIASELSAETEVVHHLHYPKVEGVMAHQLNYAIDSIREEGLFAVYNADSRPDPETFRWVSANSNATSSDVFQQYGIYTKNLKYLKTRKQAAILVANALWQCRWTYGFEYYRAASAKAKSSWPHLLRPFNYTIGHGLIVPTQLMRKIRFSENTINEDAILGIEIDARDIILKPIPYFDLAESPDSLQSIYIQKTNWFQGPFQSFIYRKYILQKKMFNALWVSVSCIKLFSHAIYWIFGPLSVVLTCILSIYYAQQNIFYFLYMLGPIIYLFLPALFSNMLIRITYHQEGDAPSLKNLTAARYLMLGSLLAYIIHGAAGVRGVLLSRKIANGQKLKTKMMQYEG